MVLNFLKIRKMDKNLKMGVWTLWVYGLLDIGSTLAVIHTGSGYEANPVVNVTGMYGLIALKLLALYVSTKYYFGNPNISEMAKRKSLLVLIVFFSLVVGYNLFNMLP